MTVSQRVWMIVTKNVYVLHSGPHALKCLLFDRVRPAAVCRLIADTDCKTVQLAFKGRGPGINSSQSKKAFTFEYHF